ncbi:MAG: PQQ-binding-like beta-propeller repeat protein [Candidatus Eisenbacteria bacterium]|nr:PQQ-binding-like beta-propeller repeat protein [Candidatus Eisenbacteria bacterium]
MKQGRRRRAGALSLVLVLALAHSFGCGRESRPVGDPRPGPRPGETPPDTSTRILSAYRALPAVYYGSPALSPDERTVYIGTSLWHFATPQSNHAFVALNTATGGVRWRYELGAGIVRSSPAVAADGSVYFMVEGRNPTPDSLAAEVLCRFSSDGRLLWSRNINPTGVTTEVGLSAPAIGADGSVYAAGDRLYAFRPDGSLKWAQFEPTFEARHNSPVIGRDGTVYFVFHNIPLTALDPDDGSILWSCPLGVNDHCFSSPGIGADGTLYVTTQPGLVYAVSSAGQILWQFDIASAGFQGFLRSSPAVDADGTIYFGLNFGSPSSALFALKSDGTVRWIFEPHDLPADVPGDHFDIYSSPAIGSDSSIYFGQELGRVYSLNPADGSVRWMQATHSGITWSSPALAAGGSLFIGDLDGYCYSIRVASRGLKATAAWPKYRGDNQNSGRAGP